MKHKRLIVGLSLFHLGVVVVAAAYCLPTWPRWLDHIVHFYGVATGAGSNYGFFTSSVRSQVLTRFEIVDSRGKKSPATLPISRNHEAEVRRMGLGAEFSVGKREADVKRFQRSLSASLAGTVFGCHPEAVAVIVHLEEFATVSMEEYRQGKRPAILPLYDLTFVRDSQRVTANP